MNQRSIDVHTLAQDRYRKINDVYFIDEKGASKMNMTETLKLCGIPDHRIGLTKDEMVKKGKPHNALEDARLSAECISRLIYGRNLLPEYVKFEIPRELKNDN